MIASVTGESTHKKKTLHDSNKTLRLPSFISAGVHLGLMIRARRWSENEKISSLLEMCGGKKLKWSGLAREFVNNSPLWVDDPLVDSYLISAQPNIAVGS